MKIIYIDAIESTQIWLENALKEKSVEPPICLWTLNQTGGIGSRNNKWLGLKGNLAFSFAVWSQSLPRDLPPQSASLYFGFLFKETLAGAGSRLWIKWPNDLYIGEKKIGGVVTKRFADILLCGIGLNKTSPSAAYGAIDIDFDEAKALGDFLGMIESGESWGEVFSRYRLEYPLSQAFQTHGNESSFSLREAVLESDGSVRIGQERVFSQR